MSVRVELVVEPRPDLSESARAALREVLAARGDVARAYLLRQRRTVPGEEPTLTTALSLVPADPGDGPHKQDDLIRLVVAVSEGLGEEGAGIAIGVPSRRALPSIEKYGVLVYEREAS